MRLHSVIVRIDCLTKIRKCLMPVMMTDFLLQRSPGGLLRILLWGVGGEMDDGEPGMGRQPFFHLVASMVRRLIEPQYDLAVRMICSDQLQPTEGGLTLLPVDHKTTDFLAGAQMNRPVDVLRFLTPGSIRHKGRLADRIPAPGECPF